MIAAGMAPLKKRACFEHEPSAESALTIACVAKGGTSRASIAVSPSAKGDKRTIAVQREVTSSTRHRGRALSTQHRTGKDSQHRRLGKWMGLRSLSPIRRFVFRLRRMTSRKKRVLIFEPDYFGENEAIIDAFRSAGLEATIVPIHEQAHPPAYSSIVAVSTSHGLVDLRGSDLHGIAAHERVGPRQAGGRALRPGQQVRRLHRRHHSHHSWHCHAPGRGMGNVSLWRAMWFVHSRCLLVQR